MLLWQRCFVAFVAALMLHASMIAALPLVWCVGAHGHNAIEVCAFLSCHHNAASGTGDAAQNDGALGVVLTTGDAHSEPCFDGKVIEEQLSAPQIEPLVAAPVLVPIPAPLATMNSSVVIPGARVLCERAPSQQVLLSNSRSPVLRI
jgi:hypothetical protein